ncbi:MAG: UDP-N-acetylmuramate dehydrogenase [Bacillota bacterium]|jgi:UDP-N-acetylmuramate dehydrogenase
MGGGSADSSAVYEQIASSLTNSQVLFSEPMSNHTSFRIGGPCDLLVIPGTRDDAINAWLMCKRLNVPCHTIGNGTNLLVRDGGVRGCIIKLASGYTGIERNGSKSLMVSSGTLLHTIVEASVDYELSGLEFAVGIPGSMGGAVTMNAGAYGGDIGSLVRRAEVATTDGTTQWISSEEAQFSYRNSLFLSRDDLLILNVEIVLEPGDKNRIRQVMMEHLKQREEKQPLDMPSAGSAFRRPTGRYVGAMIEELGLKGFSCGGAMVSPKHAGFIVNHGGATAKDVLTLMDIIKQKVYENYGVVLEPEIIVIGEDLESG